MTERLARAVAALEPEGGSVLLLGEPGSGKGRLAEEAAYELERRIGTGVKVFLLPAPSLEEQGDEEVFEDWLLAQLGVEPCEERDARGPAAVSAAAKLVLDTVLQESDGRAPVIVAPSVDRYPARPGALLASLVRTGRVRLVATARYLSGAAEQISRHPRLQRLSIGPLSRLEANTMLTQLLGCEQIEFSTLHRWYAITNGYAHSLTVLALALDRRGLLERERGMIWERTRNFGAIPEEFLTYLGEACTAEELETLETIAVGEPITEAALLEKLSPAHLRALQSMGLVVPREREGGEVAITTSHELLASSLKSRMGADRRRKIGAELYMALRHGFDKQEELRTPNRLFRLVSLGLEAGRVLPIEWLVAALDDPGFERDPETKLTIARAIIRHPDVLPARLAEAAIGICHTARLLGDRRAVDEAMEIIGELLDPGTRKALTVPLRIRLQVELVTHLTLDRERYEEAFEHLEQLKQLECEPGSAAAEMVRCAYPVFYARTGQLRKVLECAPDPEEQGRMELEWVRSQARLVSSLTLSQQGRFSAAFEVADRTRTFAALGGRVERFIGDQLTLAMFISRWASGSLLAASEILEQVQTRSLSLLQNTGFVEGSSAILAVGQGRWRDAVLLAERAVARFGERDPFGMLAIFNGVLAYAQAALGERAESRRSILASEIASAGTGQVLRGVVRILTLEARHWNGEADVVEQANRTIAWARREELPFIELRAMQVLASVQGGLDSARLMRAREISARIDEPMGSALLGFIEEVNAGESAWDAPSARILTDLGVWLPLPHTPLLSAREREIALHAALGYSSKWIAERFFLSTRTVETHLRHVFTKLGVTGRDELRSYLRGGKLSA